MSSRRSVVVVLGLVLLVVLAVQGVGDASAAHTGPTRNLVLPTISGSALQGRTLMASTGSWSESPTRYAYQWSDCNQSGTNCVTIPAASAAKLTLLAHDVGHTIRVVVTASNSSGSTTAQSAPTSVVQPAVTPDVTTPSTPSVLSTSGVAQTAVTLSWAASSDNVGVTGYRLYLGGSQVGTSLTTELPRLRAVLRDGLHVCCRGGRCCRQRLFAGNRDSDDECVSVAAFG